MANLKKRLCNLRLFSLEYLFNNSNLKGDLFANLNKYRAGPLSVQVQLVHLHPSFFGEGYVHALFLKKIGEFFINTKMRKKSGSKYKTVKINVYCTHFLL